MTLPHSIMWATVAVVGVPSAMRNPTAAALVVSWLFSESLFLLTGNGLALEYFVFPDIAVIAVIFCKRDWKPCETYRSAWHQLKCVLLERSPSDRLIVCSYPICWALYVSDIDPYYQWWGLFHISVAQFLAAGWEALHGYWISRSSIIRRHLGDIDALFFSVFSPVPSLCAADCAPNTATGGGGSG